MREALEALIVAAEAEAEALRQTAKHEVDDEGARIVLDHAARWAALAKAGRDAMG